MRLIDGKALRVARQYTHGAWSELKTDNARRRVPLPASLLQRLKERRTALDGNVVRLDGQDDRLVFPGPEGKPLDYFNWRNRVWLPLLRKTGPDERHPKRVAVAGTFHMLRHSFATALIQSGENAKTVATLVGHHSVAFTMDQYADAWPEALNDAAEKVAAVLFPKTGSISVAVPEKQKPASAQVVELDEVGRAGIEPATNWLKAAALPLS